MKQKTKLKDLKLSELLSLHTKLLDKVEEAEATFKVELAPMKDKLKAVKAAAESKFSDADEKSVTAKDGTNIHWKDVSKYKVTDKDAYFEFATELEDPEFFEARAPKKYLDEFVNDHEGKLPPGIEHNSSQIIIIKRKG